MTSRTTGAPELRRLVVGDDPASWMAAGFAVAEDGTTSVGGVAISLVGGDERGVVAWQLATTSPPPSAANGSATIDGIATEVSSEPPAGARVHPNGVVRVDHVVISTPDLERTLSALSGWGFEPRRTRDVPDSHPPRRQVFFWAGEPIVELVGPAVPRGDRPARIWGLALTAEDLDRTASHLGAAMSTPRPAVQPGRRIASIRSEGLGISVPLAVMSPHRQP